MDPYDFQETVLKHTTSLDANKRLIAELQLTLFVAAAKVKAQAGSSINAVDTNYDNPCLNPFPFWFCNTKEKSKDYVQLNTVIDELPTLSSINEETDLPDLSWKLLYWVFTNPSTNIAPICASMVDSMLAKTSLKIKRNWFDEKWDVVHWFKMEISTPKRDFINGKEKFGSFFAFYCGKMEYFHSIINRGFKSLLSMETEPELQKTDVPGIYITTNFDIFGAFNTAGWDRSIFDLKHGCIGVCEVVNHPDLVTKIDSPYDLCIGTASYRVKQAELIQLEYLCIS